MAETGVEVFGVSPDSVKRHVKFREKYSLPYRLLSDEGHRVADAFGVWVEKSFAGRTYFGTERTTFIIGEDGRIDRVLPQVKPAAHVDSCSRRSRHERGANRWAASAVVARSCSSSSPSLRSSSCWTDPDPMIWVFTAIALVLWLVGVILRLGQWVNLLLLVAAVLLVYQVIEERRPRSE